MHWVPIGQSLVLIFVANGVPFAAKFLLGSRFDYPVDLNAVGIDGHPLLGRSKTIRGLILSLLITSALAPAIGLSWTFGLSIAGSAMAGDLLTSFLKRRLGMPASSGAPVIDQVAECLFPAMVCLSQLDLNFIDMLVMVATFISSDILLAKAGAALCQGTRVR